MIKEVNLVDVCEVVAGQSPPSSTYNQEGDGMPFFQGKADFGELYPTVRYWCNEPKKLSKPDDILFSLRAPVGPTNINRIEACIGRGLAAIRCNDIELTYLLHYLRGNEDKIASLGTGSTFKAITIGTLKELKIPLPPLDLQKKIAAILDAADAYRKKTKALIAKYDELTQSLFLDMFGDPYVNQHNHSYVKLESLVKSKKDLVDGPFGSSVNTKVDYIEDGEIPVIRTKNIKLDNTFSSDDLKFMTREKFESVIRSQVRPGDIVLTKVGTIGNVCIFPDTYQEAVLSTTGSCRIRIDESLVNKQYLLIYLNFYKPKMLEIASAGVQAFLNMKHIKGFDILLPDITLQNKFAQRLQAIEGQKKQAQASLEKAQDLFNSLLQKAFKGELV